MNLNLERDENLTSRERVKDTLKHGRSDRMPRGELCINDDVIRMELECESVGFDEKYAFVRKLGLDIFSLSPEVPCGKNALPEPEEVAWPDIGKWTGKTTLFNFAVIDGAFEVGMRMHKDLEFLTMSRRSPLAFKEFIHKVEVLNISMIRNLCDKGIDGIILADDVAYRDGFLINPETLRKYFLPSLERQVKEIDLRGAAPFYHSDGNYLEIIPDLINAGFHGIQCIEKSCGMNVHELQDRFGSSLCLWGHIEIDDIGNVSDAASREKIAQSINELREKGHVILGTTCGIFKDIDINGLKTIYKMAGQL